MAHATWRCKCGAVEAELPLEGNRIICYCETCRAFVERLGAEERLDPWGGSELIQVAPDKARITKGADQIAYLRLTEKGPLRWYTQCCKTPMANTLPTRALPFASFQVEDITPKESLPPLKGMVNLSGATGRIETVVKASIPALIGGLLAGTAKAYLTGKIKQHPFFDADGAPIGPRQDV